MIEKQQDPHCKSYGVRCLEDRRPVRPCPNDHLVELREYIRHIGVIVEGHDCKCCPEKSHCRDKSRLHPLPEAAFPPFRPVCDNKICFSEIVHLDILPCLLDLFHKIHDVSDIGRLLSLSGK